MAKTGSSSITAALRAAGERSVHHVHDLDATFLDREEVEYRWAGRPWRIWDAQQLLRRPPTTARPWRVVSMVRDPIAQSVSAFFQPAVRRGYARPGTDLEALRDRFGDRLDRLPLHWFESHLLPTLGIDVYAFDFNPALGYRLITTETVQLLLLRCEDLAAASTGLAELLGRDDPVPVPHLNLGADKDYAELYESFRRSLQPSAQQLEVAYGSRLTRHFYSTAEIDQFRARWSGEPALPDGAASPDAEAAR